MKLLKRDPVVLTRPQRNRIAQELLASLNRHNCEVRILCVDATHAHILARLPEPATPSQGATARNPHSAHIRHLMGIAKKDAARSLSDEGLVPRGGIWSKRGLAKLIRDDAHLEATIRYIKAHETDGAVVHPKPTDSNPWA